MEDKRLKLLEMVKENFNLTFVEDRNLEEVKLKELKLDSLDFAQMVYDIETLYNYRFTKAQENDMAELTFGQLFSLLEAACTS